MPSFTPDATTHSEADEQLAIMSITEFVDNRHNALSRRFDALPGRRICAMLEEDKLGDKGESTDEDNARVDGRNAWDTRFLAHFARVTQAW